MRLLFLLLFLFTIIGCGGGGSNSTGNNLDSQEGNNSLPTKWDKGNWDKLKWG